MSLYLLTPCSLEGLQSIYTETDLSGVVGKFISIEESEACYEVSEVEEEPCGETTCNTIQVTYTLVGGEPVTVEVGSSGTINGKPVYYSGENNSVYLSWGSDSGGVWIFEDTELNIDIAVLYSDTPCPFGTYTILKGSKFESFEVEPVCTPPPTTDVNLLTCFNTCEDCNKPFYKLTDCKNFYPPIYTTDTRLEDHISNIIKIPYYQYSCFNIEKIPFQPGTLATQYVDFSNAYTNCDACEQQDYSEPNFDTCGCPAEKVEKVACTFVDLMYQQMMARRLGIEFCCPIEKEITIIRLRKLENQLLCTETPDFPEPEIVECCIVLPNSCSCQVTNCGCSSSQTITEDCGCDTIQVTYTSAGGEPVTVEVGSSGTINGKPVYYSGENNSVHLSWDSDSGGVWIFEDTELNIDIAVLYSDTPCPFGTYTTEEGSYLESISVENNCGTITIPQTCEEIATEEIPDCNCSSSGENSPHDCHTYTVSTTTEQLGLATGNTNIALNNKVFFCYFPCKNEKPKTVVIKTATEKEYCVLGIPLQGYYANDVFVPITLTRGEVCEPPTQTCN